MRLGAYIVVLFISGCTSPEPLPIRPNRIALEAVAPGVANFVLTTTSTEPQSLCPLPTIVVKNLLRGEAGEAFIEEENCVPVKEGTARLPLPVPKEGWNTSYLVAVTVVLNIPGLSRISPQFYLISVDSEGTITGTRHDEERI